MSLERRLGLKDDESLQAVVREAAITRLALVLFVAFLLLAPLFFLVPLLRWRTIGTILMGLSWGLGLFLGLRGWVVWHDSLCAVTQRRLILVRRRGFFERQVTDLPYSRIYEVSHRVKGIFATVFRYGTLLIESAGSQEPLTVDRVRRPQEIQDLVAEQREQADRGRGDYGEMLQAVSRMDGRKLAMLKSEIERVQRLRPPDDAPAAR
jgi:hypothetical protein